MQRTTGRDEKNSQEDAEGCTDDRGEQDEEDEEGDEDEEGEEDEEEEKSTQLFASVGVATGANLSTPQMASITKSHAVYVCKCGVANESAPLSVSGRFSARAPKN